MGFDIESVINIQSLPGEYFCPVCRQLVYPNEAMQTLCTHLYCKPCLTYIVSTTKACPYDNYLVTDTDSKPLLESNPTLAEAVGRVAVYCLYQKSGCTWQGTLSEGIVHVQNCAYGNSPVVCNRCATQLIHKQVLEHAQNCPGTQAQTQQQQGNTQQTQGAVAAAAPNDQTPAQTPQAAVPSQVQTHPSQVPPTQAVPAQQSAYDQWYQQYQQYYQQYPQYNQYQQYQHPGQYQQQVQNQMQAPPQSQFPQQAQLQPQPQTQVPQQAQLQPQVQAQVQQTQLQPQPQSQVSQTHVPHQLAQSQAPQNQIQTQPQSQVPQNQLQSQVSHAQLQPRPQSQVPQNQLQSQPQSHVPQQQSQSQIPQAQMQAQSQPQVQAGVQPAAQHQGQAQPQPQPLLQPQAQRPVQGQPQNQIQSAQGQTHQHYHQQHAAHQSHMVPPLAPNQAQQGLVQQSVPVHLPHHAAQPVPMSQNLQSNPPQQMHTANQPPNMQQQHPPMYPQQQQYPQHHPQPHPQAPHQQQVMGHPQQQPQQQMMGQQPSSQLSNANQVLQQPPQFPSQPQQAPHHSSQHPQMQVQAQAPYHSSQHPQMQPHEQAKQQFPSQPMQQFTSPRNPSPQMQHPYQPGPQYQQTFPQQYSQQGGQMNPGPQQPGNRPVLNQNQAAPTQQPFQRPQGMPFPAPQGRGMRPRNRPFQPAPSSQGPVVNQSYVQRPGYRPDAAYQQRPPLHQAAPGVARPNSQPSLISNPPGVPVAIPSSTLPMLSGSEKPPEVTVQERVLNTEVPKSPLNHVQVCDRSDMKGQSDVRDSLKAENLGGESLKDDDWKSESVKRENLENEYSKSENLKSELNEATVKNSIPSEQENNAKVSKVVSSTEEARTSQELGTTEASDADRKKESDTSSELKPSKDNALVKQERAEGHEVLQGSDVPREPNSTKDINRDKYTGSGKEPEDASKRSPENVDGLLEGKRSIADNGKIEPADHKQLLAFRNNPPQQTQEISSHQNSVNQLRQVRGGANDENRAIKNRNEEPQKDDDTFHSSSHGHFRGPGHTLRQPPTMQAQDTNSFKTGQGIGSRYGQNKGQEWRRNPQKQGDFHERSVERLPYQRQNSIQSRNFENPQQRGFGFGRVQDGNVQRHGLSHGHDKALQASEQDRDPQKQLPVQSLIKLYGKNDQPLSQGQPLPYLDQPDVHGKSFQQYPYPGKAPSNMAEQDPYPSLKQEGPTSMAMMPPIQSSSSALSSYGKGPFQNQGPAKGPVFLPSNTQSSSLIARSAQMDTFPSSLPIEMHRHQSSFEDPKSFMDKGLHFGQSLQQAASSKPVEHTDILGINKPDFLDKMPKEHVGSARFTGFQPNVNKINGESKSLLEGYQGSSPFPPLMSQDVGLKSLHQDSSKEVPERKEFPEISRNYMSGGFDRPLASKADDFFAARNQKEHLPSLSKIDQVVPSSLPHELGPSAPISYSASKFPFGLAAKPGGGPSKPFSPYQSLSSFPPNTSGPSIIGSDIKDGARVPGIHGELTAKISEPGALRSDFMVPRTDFTRNLQDPLRTHMSPGKEYGSLSSERVSLIGSSGAKAEGLPHVSLPFEDFGRDNKRVDEQRGKLFGFHSAPMQDTMFGKEYTEFGSRLRPFSSSGLPGGSGAFPNHAMKDVPGLSAFSPNVHSQGLSVAGFSKGPVPNAIESIDLGQKRKSDGMGWCRICNIDCYNVQELEQHTQTKEHQKKALDLVMRIKSDNAKRQKSSADDSVSKEDGSKAK
eukprot:TRINITY_DN1631_c0_g1_i1.p1 TRINITY_DN1631_c0_g1~~TRINITY_DN1631_c0_g1_i1.p1  ORF type:complete len:1740 (-),score=376.45 TRINITY_DN1631_c0_g1_i1:405-5624(-)